MSIHQIKVTLCNIDPPIWRRIQVRSDMRLDQLHDLLQIVMGWENDHLHGFRAGRKNYGKPDPFSDTIDERKARLNEVAEKSGKLIYEYDFGDSWEHELEIETVFEPEPGVHYPRCLAGERACPPEDCGGFPGYEYLLEALRNPKNEEHAERLEWLGDFDPEVFDLDKINTRLGNRALAPLPPTPVYSNEDLAPLDPEALLELMIRDEDRVPRNVIDACVRHGDAMVQCLSVVLEDDRYWDETATRGEWWLLLHAVMILGLMPGADAGRLLTDLMQRLGEEEDVGPDDWFHGYWPALFRNKPEVVLPALRTLSADHDLDFLTRAQAIDTIVAFAQRGSTLESALDWAAGIAADEQEDWDLRLSTGNLLLNFPRERHRALLDDLAARQTGWGVMFATSDVHDAYAAMQDKPEWDRFQDPWKFYSTEQIEARRQRWETEDRALEEDEDDDDEGEWDSTEPKGRTFFRRTFLTSAPHPRSAVTTCAPAAVGKNTRSAVCSWNRRESKRCAAARQFTCA